MRVIQKPADTICTVNVHELVKSHDKNGICFHKNEAVLENKSKLDTFYFHSKKLSTLKQWLTNCLPMTRFWVQIFVTFLNTSPHHESSLLISKPGFPLQVKSNKKPKFIKVNKF